MIENLNIVAIPSHIYIYTQHDSDSDDDDDAPTAKRSKIVSLDIEVTSMLANYS